MAVGEFTCPKCGSHCFGSSQSEDGTLERLCHGYTAFGRPCTFMWNEKDDLRYGLERPQTATTMGIVS